MVICPCARSSWRIVSPISPCAFSHIDLHIVSASSQASGRVASSFRSLAVALDFSLESIGLDSGVLELDLA